MNNENNRNSKYQDYELTVLAHKGEGQRTLIDVCGLIRDVCGIIKNVQYEGLKRLAYPIQGQEKAVYLYYDFKVKKEHEADAICQLNTNLGREDAVLRHLTVKVGNRRQDDVGVE